MNLISKTKTFPMTDADFDSVYRQVTAKDTKREFWDDLKFSTPLGELVKLTASRYWRASTNSSATRSSSLYMVATMSITNEMDTLCMKPTQNVLII